MATYVTVSDFWKLYEPISRRDNDTWKTDQGRANHLIRHLGSRKASMLSLADIDEYRTKRLGELTVRKAPPSSATLDREVELLKRFLNYGVACRKLYVNPVAKVQLLAKPNTRKSVVTPDVFVAFVGALPEYLRAPLTVAYDTGMRIGEVLGLRWDQLDMTEGCVALEEEDTKTNEARKVYLTSRALEMLQALEAAREEGQPLVFPSSKTGGRIRDIRKAFKTAALAIGRPDLWVHDLRRSFATRARRRGVAEKVIMRMGGWKTDSAFRRYNIVEDRDVADAAKMLDGE